MLVVLIILGVLICIGLVILVLNRLRRPTFGSVAAGGHDGALKDASNELSILTWNIGYAGLGREADFFADKGKSIRALSRNDIQASAHEIAAVLVANDYDVICLQENAAAGFLTRGIPVREIMDSALSRMRRFYWADLKTTLLPRFLRFDHGMSSYTALQDEGCHILELPQSDAFYVGFLKKYYVGQLTRLPIAELGKDWVIINIHLSAFDEGGRVRTAQLREALEYAQREFAKGHYVVFGGDWNMRLCPTEFSHTTEPQYLEWLVDFPVTTLPKGWQIAADPNTPTMRSLQSVYREGHNFTSIVDGFIASPNVRVDHVKALDLGFQVTDHHPVQATFQAIPQD